MARAVTRIGDFCSGHMCFSPRVNDEGSTNVFANGIGVHRRGDHWVNHTCGNNTHDGTLAEGSPTVFVNGKEMSRQGDPVTCGSAALEGSPNTFCGG